MPAPPPPPPPPPPHISPSLLAAAKPLANSTPSLLAPEQHVPLTEASWESFETTLLLTISGLVFCLVLSHALYERFPSVYRPRLSSESASAPPLVASARSPLIASLYISNEQIFLRSGLDAVSLVLFVELCLKLFTVYSAVNPFILMLWFRRWSMNTICNGSPKLWGHFLLSAIMCFTVLALINKYWRAFTTYRLRYQKSLRDAVATNRPEIGESNIRSIDVAEDPAPNSTNLIPLLALHGRTIFVEGIPQNVLKSDNPDQDLKQLFQRMFPQDAIDSAIVYRLPNPQVTAALKSRDEIAIQLEEARAAANQAEAQGGHLPLYNPPFWLWERCFHGHKPDAVKAAESAEAGNEACGALARILSVANTSVQEEMDNSLRGVASLHAQDKESGDKGFVVFRSTQDRAIALRSSYIQPLKVSPAPEPRDMITRNILAGDSVFLGVDIRGWLFTIICLCLLLFWTLPVIFFTSFTKLEVLEEQFPFLNATLSLAGPRSRELLQGFLPTLAITAFMAVLPAILIFLATELLRLRSQSAVSHTTTAWYVSFQLVNVLFVSALAGGIFETIDAIIKRPAVMVDLLGTAIPDTYFFFTSYLMVQAFGVYPLELVQFGSLVGKWWANRKAKTRRQKGMARGTESPITGGYAKQWGYVMLSFAIALEFATVAPLLLPFGVLFFGLAGATLRHHLYLVYKVEFDGEGRIFAWVMGALCLILVISHITLVGIFYQKEAYWQSSLSWVMVFIVVGFWSRQRQIYLETFDSLPRDPNEEFEMEVSHGASDPIRRPLSLLVESQSYAHLVRSNTDETLEPLADELDKGVEVKCIETAAEAYLHPDILRARLGPLDVRPEELDDEVESLDGGGPPYKKAKSISFCYNNQKEVLRIGSEQPVSHAEDGSPDEKARLLGGSDEASNVENVSRQAQARKEVCFWLTSQIGAFLMLGVIILYFHVDHRRRPPVCLK